MNRLSAIAILLSMLHPNWINACDTPNGLKISNLTSSSVTLQWNPVSGIEVYEVEIEDAENTPAFEKETKTSALSWNVNGLVAGGQYKFKVKAKCNDEDSDHSPWFFFNTSSGGNGGGSGDGGTAGGSCVIPNGLAVSNITGNSATLSWNAAQGAVRYEVEVEDGDNTPPFQFEQKTTSTTIQVTGLSTGGSYKFKVKSECASGSSDHSPWFFFNTGSGGNGGGSGDGGTAGGSCVIPNGLAVSNITGNSATLSWNAAQGAVRYEVEVEDGDNTPPFQFEQKTTSTTIQVTGLSTGGSYKFKVKSECASGSSDHSPWFFFNTGSGGNGGGSGDDGTGGGSCVIPNGLAVSNITGNSATLSWNAAQGAVRYEVEVEDGDNTPPFQFEQKTTSTTIQVIGLSAGGSYKFKVKSECASGSSDHSPWFFFNTGSGGNGGGSGDDGTPGASCVIPNGLAVSNITGNSATLSWNAAQGAVRYEVEVEDGDNTPPFQFEQKTTSTTIQVTGLSAGGSYKFKVKSECASGSSDHSPWFFFNTGSGGSGGGSGDGNTTGGSCVIPNGLAVSNITGNSATLSWNAAQGAVRYEVEVEDGDNTPPFQFEQKTTSTTIQVTGLSAGGSYKFKVKSECASGSSDHSPWFFFNTGSDGNGGGSGDGDTTGANCVIPDSLAVSNITGNSATLTWNAAQGAVSYEVEVEDSDNTPLFQYEVKTNLTSVVVIGLVRGGSYKFKVRSECTSGTSDYSPWFFFETNTGDNGDDTSGGDNGTCPIPEGLNVTDFTGESATLSWKASEGAVRYEIEVEDGDDTPIFQYEARTNLTSITIMGLLEGGSYKFKVKSECVSGSSDHSPWFFFGKNSDGNGGLTGGSNGTCNKPDELSVSNYTGTSATLRWNRALGAQRYEVEVEDAENSLTFQFEAKTNLTSITVTGLVEGSSYKFKVKSECVSGSSDHSPWFFFGNGTNEGNDDNNGVCAIPTGLNMMKVSGTSGVLSWNATPGAIRYEVEVENDENTAGFHFEAITGLPSLIVTGLVEGGSYKFKVKSECGSGSSDYSPWFFFDNKQAGATESDRVNISVFPNPANTYLRVHLDKLEFQGKSHVTLLDLSGRVVWRTQFEEGILTNLDIPVAHLQTGIYQLTVQAANRREYLRVLISH